MSRLNGQMRTCDRCGKSAFFKCIGDGELDCGYTRWNNFEEATDWSVERGDLCPDCTHKLKNVMDYFYSHVTEE